mgnify:CR=1 FL=1
MGDYAASGGYFVAVPADKIVAHPMTLTGSIVAFLKLSGRIKSNPLMLPAHNLLNLGALTTNGQLDQAAQGMANEMVDNVFFSHETPDGRNLVDRVEPGASTVPIGRPVSNTRTYA